MTLNAYLTEMQKLHTMVMDIEKQLAAVMESTPDGHSISWRAAAVANSEVATNAGIAHGLLMAAQRNLSAAEVYLRGRD